MTNTLIQSANLSLRKQLQEAERQRDEAHDKCNNLCEQLTQEEGKQTVLQAERDQLIKVVDELASDLECMDDKYGYTSASLASLESYSLLPHVQAKKGNKQ